MIIGSRISMTFSIFGKMSKDYKGPIGFIVFLSVLIVYTLNSYANTNMDIDPGRVVSEAGTVQKLTGNQLTAVTDFGSNLGNGDEIITASDSRADVILSMLSETDEIIMGSLTRIRFSFKLSDVNIPIYKIHLLYGKIRVKTMLNRSRQVHFVTNLAELNADEGEFILESSKKGTTIGVLDGVTEMVVKSTNRQYRVSENSNMFISGFSPVSPAKSFSRKLYKGVEKHEREKTVDLEALQKKLNLQKRKEKEKRLYYEELENRKKSSSDKEQQRQEESLLKKEHKQKKVKEAILKETIKKEKSPSITEQESQLPESLDEPERDETIASMAAEEIEEESFLSKYGWHITASSTTLVFGYLAMEEANSYNSLSSENESIQSEYDSSTSTNERSSLMTEYEVNKEKMSQHKSNMQLYNYITMGALVWEGYLLYSLIFNDSADEAVTASGISIDQNKYINLEYTQLNPGIRFSFNWYW